MSALQLPGLYKKKAAFDPDMEGFSESDAELQKSQKPGVKLPSSKAVKPAKAQVPAGVKGTAQAQEQAAKPGKADGEFKGKRKGGQARRALPGRLRKKLAKQREA